MDWHAMAVQQMLLSIHRQTDRQEPQSLLLMSYTDNISLSEEEDATRDSDSKRLITDLTTWTLFPLPLPVILLPVAKFLTLM